MHGAHQRAADAEDVAQEAFWGFYRSLKQGRLPLLTNRYDLLALLVLVIARRAATQIRDEHRAKRGGGAVQGESALDLLASSSQHQQGMALVPDSARTPQEEAILHDCYQTYIAGLPDKLRDFAELYLAGCTHREIAQRLGCVERTVERKIPIILKKWQAMAADSEEPGE